MATTVPPAGAKLPLLFTYTDRVFGSGFFAEVRAANGRALCVHEDDGFWMYGLNPGGLAASGNSPQSAHRAFRKTFSRILVDIASEAANLEEFRALVADFFNQTNEGFEADWAEAVDAVRRERVAVEGLRRLPANSPRSITVERKREDAFSVEDNTRRHYEQAIAA